MEQRQVRQRFTRWIEDTKELFAVLPDILNHDHDLGAKAGHVEQEAERLRREVAELRKELADVKTQRAELRQDHENLQRALDEARKQNEQLRTDKDEAAQALARVLETVQATNQIAQKLGVSRSPFARRDATAPAADSQPASQD